MFVESPIQRKKIGAKKPSLTTERYSWSFSFLSCGIIFEIINAAIRAPIISRFPIEATAERMKRTPKERMKRIEFFEFLIISFMYFILAMIKMNADAASVARTAITIVLASPEDWRPNMTARSKTEYSNRLSRIPIPMIAFPSFFFRSPNFSMIGISITSFTVVNIRARAMYERNKMEGFSDYIGVMFKGYFGIDGFDWRRKSEDILKRVIGTGQGEDLN